jgi:hypothetical protein
MFAARRLGLVTASAIAALAVAASAHAQDSAHNAKGGNGHKSKPPSSSALPGPTTGASPLSWVDDASLLAPGTMSLTISAMRWSGADLSEVDVPIVDASVGLTKRFQIGASVPRIVGSADGTGPVGGFGTSYISGKVAILTEPEIKVAVSPILEILGAGAVQALPAGESRYQFGLPVSLEVAQGPVRMFAATGFFTRGAWFAGGGTGFQLSPRTGASISFTRSWAKTDVDGIHRDRREIAGGLSYFVKPQIGLYGSVGHTVATTDENGAGMSVSGGVTFFFTPGITK